MQPNPKPVDPGGVFLGNNYCAAFYCAVFAPACRRAINLRA